jgi:hypothetical protein
MLAQADSSAIEKFGAKAEDDTKGVKQPSEVLNGEDARKVRETTSRMWTEVSRYIGSVEADIKNRQTGRNATLQEVLKMPRADRDIDTMMSLIDVFRKSLSQAVSAVAGRSDKQAIQVWTDLLQLISNLRSDVATTSNRIAVRHTVERAAGMARAFIESVRAQGAVTAEGLRQIESQLSRDNEITRRHVIPDVELRRYTQELKGLPSEDAYHANRMMRWLVDKTKGDGGGGVGGVSRVHESSGILARFQEFASVVQAVCGDTRTHLFVNQSILRIVDGQIYFGGVRVRGRDASAARNLYVKGTDEPYREAEEDRGSEYGLDAEEAEGERAAAERRRVYGRIEEIRDILTNPRIDLNDDRRVLPAMWSAFKLFFSSLVEGHSIRALAYLHSVKGAPMVLSPMQIFRVLFCTDGSHVHFGNYVGWCIRSSLAAVTSLERPDVGPRVIERLNPVVTSAEERARCDTGKFTSQASLKKEYLRILVTVLGK